MIFLKGLQWYCWFECRRSSRFCKCGRKMCNINISSWWDAAKFAFWMIRNAVVFQISSATGSLPFGRHLNSFCMLGASSLGTIPQLRSIGVEKVLKHGRIGGDSGLFPADILREHAGILGFVCSHEPRKLSILFAFLVGVVSFTFSVSLVHVGYLVLRCHKRWRWVGMRSLLRTPWRIIHWCFLLLTVGPPLIYLRGQTSPNLNEKLRMLLVITEFFWRCPSEIDLHDLGGGVDEYGNSRLIWAK